MQNRNNQQINTVDRYQYDIDSLKSWLNQNSTNPYTRQDFTERDKQRIKKTIESNYPGTPVIFHSSNHNYPGGDPDLEATLAAIADLTGLVGMNSISPVIELSQYDFQGIGILHSTLTYQYLASLLLEAIIPQLNLPSTVMVPILTIHGNPDIAIHSIPDWLSARAAVQLTNGCFAIARNDNHGEVQIINPETNTIIYTIHDDHEVSALAQLANGNLVVGHYDTEAYLNIYNLMPYEKVQSISQIDTHVVQCLMIARGNIIITGSFYVGHNIIVSDAETGLIVKVVPTDNDMQIDSMIELGNNIAFICTTWGGGKKCIVYDSDFNIVNSFHFHSGGNITVATSLSDGTVAFVCSDKIQIYNPVSGNLLRQFQIPHLNVIRSIIQLENGNLLVCDALGSILEFTCLGTPLLEARINNVISSPVLLKKVYEILSAEHALQAVLTGDHEHIPPSVNSNHHHSMFYHPPLNQHMLDAVTILDGLLPAEYLHHWPTQRPFTSAHRDAIVYLIIENNLSPRDAVDQIWGLDEDEARQLLPHPTFIMEEVD